MEFKTIGPCSTLQGTNEELYRKQIIFIVRDMKYMKCMLTVSPKKSYGQPNFLRILTVWASYFNILTYMYIIQLIHIYLYFDRLHTS